MSTTSVMIREEMHKAPAPSLFPEEMPEKYYRGLTRSQYRIKKGLQVAGALIWVWAYSRLTYYGYSQGRFTMPFFIDLFYLVHEFWSLKVADVSPIQKFINYFWSSNDFALVLQFLLFSDPAVDYPYFFFNHWAPLCAFLVPIYWFILEFFRKHLNDERGIYSAFVLATLMPLEVYYMYQYYNFDIAFDFLSTVLMYVGCLLYSVCYIYQPVWKNVRWITLAYTITYFALGVYQLQNGLGL